MRIKDGKEQIREEVRRVETLINFQTMKTDKAYKRFRQRVDWAVSFLWIWDNAHTLDYIYRQEDGILSALKVYQSSLRDRII